MILLFTLVSIMMNLNIRITTQMLLLMLCSLSLNSVQAVSWQSADVPTKDERTGKINGPFDPTNVTSDNILFYQPAVLYVDDKSINWTITLGQGAYLQIYMPPGVEKLRVFINAASLAGSRKLMFKDFGERDCDAELPEGLNYSDFFTINNNKEKEIVPFTPPGWEINAGSVTIIHERNEGSDLFKKTNSCLILGFFNRENNYESGIQLDEVSLTYLIISDLDAFGKWANKLTVKVEGDGTVSGGKITNCSSSVVCETNYLETTNLTATTNTGTKVSWEGDSCIEDPNDNFKATVNYNKDIGSDTCHVKFLAPLTVQVTGIGSVTGTGIDCNENSLCTADFLAGVPVQLTANRADAVWGGSCSDNGQIKNVITGIEPCVVTFPPAIEISVDNIPVEMGGVVTFTAAEPEKTLTIKNSGGLPLTFSSLQYPAGFRLTTVQLLDSSSNPIGEVISLLELSSEVPIPISDFFLESGNAVLLGIQLDAEMDEHLGSFILETNDNDASPFTVILYAKEECN
jgi:hypothetical protein